jgi:hypothetical protein
MIVHIRLDMTDAKMKAFENVFGVRPRRKAIVAEVVKMLDHALFPDGEPKKKKQKFTLRRS